MSNQSSTQIQVKTKKKIITSADVLFFIQMQVKTKKKIITSADVFFFHCNSARNCSINKKHRLWGLIQVRCSNFCKCSRVARNDLTGSVLPTPVVNQALCYLSTLIFCLTVKALWQHHKSNTILFGTQRSKA